MKATKKLLALLLSVLMVLSMAACGAKTEAPAAAPEAAAPAPEAAAPAAEAAPAEEAAPAAADGIKTEVDGAEDIAFVTFMTGIPYFDSASAGAFEAAKDLGISLGYYGPASNDTPGQIAIIDDLITQGVKGLVVTCMDSEAVVPTLQKAREAGIKVVTWDLDVSNPAGRDYFANLVSTEVMGQYMIDLMYNNHVDTLGDSFEYSIITSSLTSELMIQRVEDMISYAEEKYPGLKCVGYEAGDSDSQKTYNAAVSLMQANPDMKVILSNASDALGPIAEAIAAEGMIGQVYGTGMTTPNLAKPGFASGAIIGGAMLWDTAKWARFAVTLCNEAINGTTYPMGEEFSIPGFPEAVQVSEDEFQYNEMQEFTKDNISSFDF